MNAKHQQLSEAKVAITGAGGFLGWHTAVRLRAVHSMDATLIRHADFASADLLLDRIGDADTIIHCAGVNRAPSDEDVEFGNIAIAETLAEAVLLAGRPIHVVYANSVQAILDNPYGRGKAEAARILADATAKSDGTFVDVRLPNLFGEHGRPAYNSFVATFAHEIANGREPTVTGDKLVPLLHVQDAAEELLGSAGNRDSFTIQPQGASHGVSEVLGILMRFHEKYREGQIPALPDQFTVDLFNTYRSYMFPQHFPFKSTVHADARGELFETVRVHGGTGQTFVSTTAPGVTRGDHFHLSKIERFFVVQGTAEIALRRVHDDEIVRFRVTGAERCFVDMPTMWVHNITNVGDDELVTMFWADQLLNPAAPDTYWEPVDQPAEADR